MHWEGRRKKFFPGETEGSFVLRIEGDIGAPPSEKKRLFIRLLDGVASMIDTLRRFAGSGAEAACRRRRRLQWKIGVSGTPLLAASFSFEKAPLFGGGLLRRSILQRRRNSRVGTKRGSSILLLLGCCASLYLQHLW